MSSAYRILCLSHDPAIVAVDEVDGPEEAESAIVHGVEGHDGCDLMMGRYSYPLVELGCPGNVGPCKRHSSPRWADIDWIRLIALAHQQPEGSQLHKAAKAATLGCFTRDRLHRLRSQREDLACPPVPEAAVSDEDRLRAVKALYAWWMVVLNPDGRRLLGELYGAVVHGQFPYEPPSPAEYGHPSARDWKEDGRG